MEEFASCEDFANYFVGVVLGDGDLYHDAKRGYRVRVTDASADYLRVLNAYLERCFGIKGRIYKHKKYSAYHLVIWRKELYELIVRRANVLLEEPTSAFVAGIIDAEGGVNKTRNGLYRLYVTNTDKRLIDAVAKVLNSLTIKYYLVSERRRYRIYVHGIDRINRLLSSIPSIHPKIRDKFSSFFSPLLSSAPASADRVIAP